jgi:hypothetical protein
MKKQAQRSMSNPSSSKKRIGVVILTLLLSPLLVTGLIELARLYFAWMVVENSARLAARYAVTGSFDTSYCDALFGHLAGKDPKFSECDLSVGRDPSTGKEQWEPVLPETNKTPQELCDMIWPGTRDAQPVACWPKDPGDPTSLTYEDVIDAMQDMARLYSIRKIALTAASDISIDPTSSGDIVRGTGGIPTTSNYFEV